MQIDETAEHSVLPACDSLSLDALGREAGRDTQRSTVFALSHVTSRLCLFLSCQGRSMHVNGLCGCLIPTSAGPAPRWVSTRSRRTLPHSTGPALLLLLLLLVLPSAPSLSPRQPPPLSTTTPASPTPSYTACSSSRPMHFHGTHLYPRSPRHPVFGRTRLASLPPSLRPLRAAP